MLASNRFYSVLSINVNKSFEKTEKKVASLGSNLFLFVIWI